MYVCMYEHSYTCLSISVSALFRVHCHCRNFLYEIWRMVEITTTSYFLCYLNICKLSLYYVLHDINLICYSMLSLQVSPLYQLKVPVSTYISVSEKSFELKIFFAFQVFQSLFDQFIVLLKIFYRSYYMLVPFCWMFYAGCP